MSQNSIRYTVETPLPGPQQVLSIEVREALGEPYLAVVEVALEEPDVVAADALGKDIRILRFAFNENDRAQAEHETDGLIKVVADKKGRVLGASIAGARAGELLLPWVMAVDQQQKIGKFAGLIAPYPTLSEVSKRAAGSYYIPSLFSERTKKIVRFLMKWF